MNKFAFKKKKAKREMAFGKWIFYWLSLAIILSLVCFAMQLA